MTKQEKERSLPPAIDFHKVKTEKAAELLRSNFDVGLTESEVDGRLKQYGHNEVAEKKSSPLLRFAKKFWGLTAWMLEIIIVLSWILQRYIDLAVVVALLFLNSILGFAEEQRASTAVEALKEKLYVNARVLRDGVWKIVSARDLVPGDIIRVRTGDFVPADVKISGGQLEVDQSALTGESIAAEKKQDDTLYSGSIVKRGEATGLVVLTGNKTYFGKTAQLVQIARPKLHMEEVVSQVVRWLAVIVTVMLSAALIFSAVKRLDLLGLLPLMLVLLLSAIPVALPAMFTVSMALGSMRLVKEGVLVTRLSASEDAATMDILCADKTGTITMNKLSVATVIPMQGFKDEDVIHYGFLASKEADQDPIDLAFTAAAKQKGMIDGSAVQKDFVPFDPETRRTVATVRERGREFQVMKGAVNVIARACGLEKKHLEELNAKVDEFSGKGYRTLAVAKDDETGSLELVGLATLYDAPRADSRQLIQELKELGISVKMLTGDALPIAEEIAKDVGLGEKILKISDLKGHLQKNVANATIVSEKSDGFAEIYPEDKYTIVQAFQSKEHVVGMTGDGVNDAPALRQAEVGIAVSNATDVAKGAASAVLTKEGLSGIVDLVKVGRSIFERITTWVLNKIITTAMVVPFVVLSFFLTGEYVVSALVMILLLFMTDFVKLALSTDNVRWSRKPDTWDIIDLVKVAIVLGTATIIELFGLLYIGFNFFGFALNNLSVHTFSFAMLFYAAMFLLLNVRERGHFWDSAPSKALSAAVIGDMIVGVLIATFGIADLKPIPMPVTLFVIAYSATFSLFLNDLIKFILVKKTKIRW
jgi:H+-transporting ATPase